MFLAFRLFFPYVVWLLVRRELNARHRGSIVGFSWNFISPMLMVIVFAAVFGQIFQQKWGQQEVGGGLNFAIPLFIGLLIFNFYSEVLVRSCSIIQNNSIYIKKVPFKVEILNVANLIAALIVLLFGIMVLFVLIEFSDWDYSFNALWALLILVPFCLMVLGLSWMLAACSVYVRDIVQILPPVMTASFFLSPVFYPVSSLGGVLKDIVYINPITFVIEEIRQVILNDSAPNFFGLAVYSLISLTILFLGLFLFNRLKKGFADEI